MMHYVVSSPLFDDDRYAIADPKDDSYGDFPKCESCGKSIGQREWLMPYRAMISKKNVGDVVFGSIFPFLLSKKACHVFSDEKIKGFKSLTKVEILNRKTELFLPVLSRGSLLVDESSSCFKRDNREVCPVCHIGGTVIYFKNLIPIKGSWDDLDVFILAQLPGTIIVSERFVNVVENGRLTNFLFTPLLEYKCPWKEY